MRGPSSTSSAASSSGKSVPTPCCSKVGIKRGPWTPEEDQILSNYINRDGEGRWRTLPKRAGLQRCGKSCRLRWMNYLRPSVKRGQIAPDEEDLILRLHRLLGNRWSLIAGRIPGRTDNEIKNYWNTHLSKKLINQGIDPRTHKPLNPSPFPNVAAQSSNNNNNNHLPMSSFPIIAPNPSTLAQPHNATLEQTQPTIFSRRNSRSDELSKIIIDNNNAGHEPMPLVVPQLDNAALCSENNLQNLDGLMMGYNNNINNVHQSYVLDHNCSNNDQDAAFSLFLDTLIGDAYVSTPHPRLSTAPVPSTPVYGQGAMWGAELRSALETLDDNRFNNNLSQNL